MNFISNRWNRIKHTPFFIKLLNWEYWPFGVIYAPAILYWFFLSIKTRSFFFFSAANPGIKTGGMLGESKINILKKVPPVWLPKTVYHYKCSSWAETKEALVSAQMSFPVIAKPDIGQRGFLVEKITSLQALQSYLSQKELDFIIQEFIDYPIELSIMYHRFPNQAHGSITSATIKEFLSVTGDGHATIWQLIQDKPRAKLQQKALAKMPAKILGSKPGKGKKVELVPFGNHCRGARFLNGNHMIDNKLVEVFDHLSQQLPGIYLGRFDLKCQSWDDLKAGKNFKILEINGVGAEPAHIYDPSYTFWRAIKDIHKQWRIIYRLSIFNRKAGESYMSFMDGMRQWAFLIRYKKLTRSYIQ
ncbi:MAG: hypothetical protein ACR2MX_15895 [Cyclobacteriaceae bacterium]